jgi:hypothetical protein
MRTVTTISLMTLAVALAGQAAAQAVGEAPADTGQVGRTQRYDAAYFAKFAPTTALDIVNQIPGFQLDLGNTDTRGFGGAAGNIVINGARPSSKADNLATVLSRIPARRVQRVEVGPGDLYGAEYAGRAQVANVVLTAEGGIDGNVTASARRGYNGKVTPTASASALIKRGQSTINLAAGLERYDQFDEGTDKLTDPVTGELFEKRRKRNSYYNRDPYVSASWALEQASDRAIRLNARFQPSTFRLTQWNHAMPVGEPDRQDRLVQRYKRPTFEIGGDITRPLAGGAIKLVGLATRRERDDSDTYFFRTPELEILGGFEQIAQAKRNETIGRLTWSRSNLGGFSIETGAEAVLNTLDSNVEFYEFEEGGARTRIDLLIDSAVVKEKRAEFFINAGRNLSPAVRLDGGLTYEMSNLTVSGDTTAERQLKFLKPSLTLDWKPGNGWHAQFSIKRTVAQLDFYDFISIAELSNDRVNAGNANLQPQRAWEFRATVDKKILGDGLVKLELGYDHISMLQDRILVFDEVGRGFDAPGNLGTGKRMFGRLSVDTPIDRLIGLSGTKLKAAATLQRTRVEDPISGEMRSFSGFYPEWQWSIELRRDVGKWSYGFGLFDRDRFTFFRTNEFDSNWNGGIYGIAFVEYRPLAKTTVTLDVDNMLNTRGLRKRELFFPNRADPQLAINEFRERNRHPVVSLTIKQGFGGSGNGGGGK